MDIAPLVQAMQTLNAEDAFRARLTLDQWRVIAPYLTRHEIRAGDLLIKQGDADRSMYFLAQGSLQVFVTGGVPGSSRIAILRAGSVVGEPGLFNDGPRMANVEAMTACEVWALRGPRQACARTGAGIETGSPTAAFHSAQKRSSPRSAARLP